MRRDYQKFLERVARDFGLKVPKKLAFFPIFDNVYWSDLINKSIDFLTIVVVGSGDYQLAGIVAMLKAWKEERETLKGEIK